MLVLCSSVVICVVVLLFCIRFGSRFIFSSGKCCFSMFSMLCMVVLVGEVIIVRWCMWVGRVCLCLGVNRFLVFRCVLSCLYVWCRVFLLVFFMWFSISWYLLCVLYRVNWLWVSMCMFLCGMNFSYWFFGLNSVVWICVCVFLSVMYMWLDVGWVMLLSLVFI